MSSQFETPLVIRAESTPDNLRQRADKDMERAAEAEAAGDAGKAQSHRDQAYVKYAIAYSLLIAAIAAAGAKAAEMW